MKKTMAATATAVLSAVALAGAVAPAQAAPAVGSDYGPDASLHVRYSVADAWIAATYSGSKDVIAATMNDAKPGGPGIRLLHKRVYRTNSGAYVYGASDEVHRTNTRVNEEARKSYYYTSTMRSKYRWVNHKFKLCSPLSCSTWKTMSGHSI